MASETVTLPRATLEAIREALQTAVDVTVAIQDLCKGNDDGLPHGAVYAIEACIEKQEALICPAVEDAIKALEGAHG